MSEGEAAEMQVFEVVIGGLPHTLQLDKETAERYGLKWPQATKQATAPANKARTADGK